MTFIKICGITNLPDAVAAIEAGADALGFNFYPPSSRYIEPASARKIIEELPASIMTFGVFVNEDSPDKVKSVASLGHVEALQLHGDESPEYCRSLSDWYVVKALAVDEQFEVQKSLAYPVNAIMLDAKHKSLRGGTGKVIDWSIAKRVNDLGVRVFLAGGLSATNVEDAIMTANPFAVDACSGLEEVPGKKDQERMRAFVKAVRSLSSE